MRFLVEMRGEDHSNNQLKDDLMTFLIAGHETTAALLTWTLYMLSQNPQCMESIQNEVDTVLQDEFPTMETISEMNVVRRTLAEALRLYPQPPLLIRRSIEEDIIPGGLDGPPEGFPIGPGADLFISSWNLHRSPRLWNQPEVFNPDRFLEPFQNPDFEGQWEGYKPALASNLLYPNEVAFDFAFLPFGGGGRKCVGDQFAFMEACVCLSMLIRRFRQNEFPNEPIMISVCSFELAGPPESVSMESGATIHTANGLFMRIKRRQFQSNTEQETESEMLSATG